MEDKPIEGKSQNLKAIDGYHHRSTLSGFHSTENEPILMKKTPSLSNTTSEDIIRIEESWTGENQDYILTIKSSCIQLRDKHAIASYNNRKKFIWFSIPTIILPLIMGQMSIFLSNMSEYAIPISLTLISILNGLSVLFDFSKKSQLHDNYENKYDELICEISSILIKKKQFRACFDVTLVDIGSKKKAIDGSSPYLY
jgi:hypothetical protein